MCMSSIKTQLLFQLIFVSYFYLKTLSLRGVRLLRAAPAITVCSSFLSVNDACWIRYL
ncbi:hypothetical protein BD408DRAFT_465731 [Parasitella parasitica]|nr:hypothetical protein BD408DRAFT_465731 [Parasitella parasitica]